MICAFLNQKGRVDKTTLSLHVAATLARRGAIGRDAREALGGLEVSILAADVSQRVGFAKSMAAGQTVFESDPGALPQAK